MSEHEHEEIARRLRAEGQASAPPDMLPSVMAEVRAESRRRRRRLRLPSFPEWRPVAAWAGAAAALVALGVGISHLDLTHGSSSSASLSSASHAERAAGTPNESLVPSPSPQTFTVSPKAAASILGTYLYAGKRQATTSSGASRTPLRIEVPSDKFDILSARLRAAERQSQGTPSYSPAPSGVVIIKLMRSHAP